MTNYNSIILTLYKGKYTKGEQGDGIKGYRVLGEFDYLRVHSLNDGLSTEEQYKEMWSKTEQISKELQVGESCHNLYAIGRQGKNYWEEFWKLEEYPFLFLSMIQLRMGDKIDIGKALGNIETFLSILINQDQYNYDVKAAIYYSLDSCDYILLLKSKQYEDGAKIIQGMPSIPYDESVNKPETLNYYSYSICGIDIEKYLSERRANEKIKKIMICFVIRDFIKFQKWFAALKEKFQAVEENIAYSANRNRQLSYSRLGNEDVCINLVNCELEPFLNEIRNEDGLLNEKNTLFKRGLMKIRIHFDVEQYYDEFKVNISEIEPSKTLIERFHESIHGDLEKSLYPSTKKALLEVLNSCSYFEQEYFVKDIQICIQNGFDIFLNKFEEFYNWNEIESSESKNKYNKQNFNDSVIEYLNGIMSVVNGALHTDRMFFQAPGFNAVLYDIPAKLLAFYTAFVKQITMILNDNEEKSFAYLLCPDLFTQIVLIKLFDNPYKYPVKRLLKGSIPVKSIFEPKRLMIELAHEVAHCVGDSMRKRTKRFHYMISMFANSLTHFLFWDKDEGDAETLRGLLPKNEFEKETRDFLESVAGYISKWIFDKFEKSQTDLGKYKDFKYYQVKTRKFFFYSIQELLDNHGELFEQIQNQYFKSFPFDDLDEVKKFHRMHSLTLLLENNLKVIQQDRHLETMVQGIHSLTNESYADMIMCKLLGVSGEEYVNLFYKANEELLGKKDVSFLLHDATGERILSVLKVLKYDVKQLKNSANDDTQYHKYLETLSEFWKNDDGERKAVFKLPKEVFMDNVEYLQCCVDELNDYSDNGKKFQEIQEIYRDVTEKDIYASAERILDIVYKMRVSLEEELRDSQNNGEERKGFLSFFKSRDERLTH